MPLQKLAPTSGPADFDVQDTALAHDVLGRYVCNTWEEVVAAQDAGGYPSDVIVVGGDMFGAYLAEKLYRLGEPLAMRVLVLEGGALLLPTHMQNPSRPRRRPNGMAESGSRKSRRYWPRARR